MEGVNINQYTMRQLAEERPCIAPWVAIQFVAHRDGTEWRSSTREARRAALQEELFRERRGDYQSGCGA